MPESCVLIIVGIVIGLIIYSGSAYDHTHHTDNRIVYFPDFTADLFFNVLLPPIILGMQIKSSCCSCSQCQR